ncbi:hypothetical protein [Caulobacter sp. 602-1]|uniref:hypothetical protein n=1 Tax=Caulobacter sp. 602-1 TaxID=2492472 RepID=UPI000F633182|nr:hypothetical protein [Caulobacter sp. 602-1]RRN62781.1 hypothetical protein EIK80_19685 [Caulobacter sp. 602-1]
MIKIYEIDGCGQWTGGVAEIEAREGCLPTWVRAPEPPDVEGDDVAVWVGGAWHIADPVLPASPPDEAPED